MNYSKTLVIHRRDLRVHDNSALLHATKASESVIPCFIFDPRQVGEGNAYRSDFAVHFLCESLKDLEEQYHKKDGKLHIFEGLAHDVLEELLEREGIDAVMVNADYTPFSVERDATLQAVCEKHGVAFESFHDALLVGDPNIVRTGSGDAYKVYTPFFRYAAANVEVPKPRNVTKHNWYTKRIKGADSKLIDRYHPNLGEARVPEGRHACISILKKIADYKGYKEERDIPGNDATTHLGAHNKFGTCSIREVYWAIAGELGQGHELIRQLYWRDFFTQLAYAYPHVFKGSFNQKFDQVKWKNDKKKFTKWCEGMTGFPIVDAGMRELSQTGYMHNRARMIAASFLTKDLHIDWRWGEQYFAQKLVDYDPCVNNGSWQWAAGTGADAAPYFRIFNPWLQQKKFDAECEYIKKWVPELAEVEPAVIHAFGEKGVPEGVEYPGTVVDHKQAAEEAKGMYGVVREA